MALKNEIILLWAKNAALREWVAMLLARMRVLGPSRQGAKDI